MSSIRNNWPGLLFLIILFLAKAPFACAADLSPYINSQTIGVVRIDLKQMKVQEYTDYFKGEINRAITEIVPQGDANATEIKKELERKLAETSLLVQFEAIRHEIVEKGKADEIFAISYKDAIFDKQFPVLIAIPIPPGASQEQIDTIRMQYLKNDAPVTFVRHGFIVGIPLFTKQGFATQRAVMAYARKKFESPSTEKRPEFAEALSTQPNALIQLVIGRIAEFQRDVDQFFDTNVKPAVPFMQPEQKEQYTRMRKGIPILFQGLNYYSASYDYNKTEIRSVIQCVDESAAKRIYDQEMSRINQRGEETLSNLSSSGMPPELQESLKAFIEGIDTKLVKNEVVTVIGPSAMTFINMLAYEALCKSAVRAAYMDATGQDGAGMGMGIGMGMRTETITETEGERQITPEMIEKFEQLMQEPLRNVPPELRPQAEKKVKDKVREMQQQMERQQRKRNEGR